MTTVLTLGVGLTAALAVGVVGATEDARAGVASTFGATAVIPTSFVEDPVALAAELDARPGVEARVEGLDILLEPAPGADEEDLRTAVLGVPGAGDLVFWASDVQRGIDDLILAGQVVGGAMIGVTMVVAMIGVMITLALSVTERRREIALVRALGVSRATARRSVAAEAAIAALVGVVAGVVLGGAYGALALVALGMAVPAPPVLPLALLGVAVLAAALLAAALPMRSAGRVPPAIGLAAR